MTSFAELHHWNTNSYGNALRVRRSRLRAAFVVLCLITPATNWLIPFVKKLIRTDFVYRYA